MTFLLARLFCGVGVLKTGDSPSRERYAEVTIIDISSKIPSFGIAFSFFISLFDLSAFKLPAVEYFRN
jgi:hypothetical protein